MIDNLRLIQKNAIIISFDGIALSGITVEILKTGKKLKELGYTLYLDLGYEIKVDKGNFNKTYSHYEKNMYKDLFSLVRINNIESIPKYNINFINYIADTLISQKKNITEIEKSKILLDIEETARKLSYLIIEQWKSLNINYVFIENGTLPENIIYTKALYFAIDIYGIDNNLEKFVIWRDHDLMWNSEKKSMKYGKEPYPYAVKPIKSKHITYVTLNDYLKKKLEEWCENKIEVQVKKNTYDFNTKKEYVNIREKFNINLSDILIARTTRIIPQKRLDRDIYLVYRLNKIFKQDFINRKVFLVVAGNFYENYDYYLSLKKLSIELKVESFIKFIGYISHKYISSYSNKITIEDLYHSCDIVSFLTSWDYDSYGNPIGEAISNQRCYITTSYEYYHEVYGKYGFEAPIMKISSNHDDLCDESFINNLYQFINNKKQMNKIARKNFLIGKDVLSNHIIDLCV